MSKSDLTKEQMAHLKRSSWVFDEGGMQFFLDLNPLVSGLVWLDSSPRGTKWFGKVIAVKEHIFDEGFDTAEECQYYVLSLIESMVLTAYTSLFRDLAQVRQ